jgi:hypothetical protein
MRKGNLKKGTKLIHKYTGRIVYFDKFYKKYFAEIYLPHLSKTYLVPKVELEVYPSRLISEIAEDIKREWKSPLDAAVESIELMMEMDAINSEFDRAAIMKFMMKSTHFRGVTAQNLRAELRKIVKQYDKNRSI